MSRRHGRLYGAGVDVGVLVWGAVLIGLVSCGGSHSDLTDAAARVLQHDVDRVTAAATAGDAGRVQRALQQLRGDVARQQHGGLSRPGQPASWQPAPGSASMSAGRRRPARPDPQPPRRPPPQSTATATVAAMTAAPAGVTAVTAGSRTGQTSGQTQGSVPRGVGTPAPPPSQIGRPGPVLKRLFLAGPVGLGRPAAPAPGVSRLPRWRDPVARPAGRTARPPYRRTHRRWG